MREVTVCLFVREGHVLLAIKNGGRGNGRWGGYGGELQKAETPKQAVRREILEECQILVLSKHLKKRAEVINHKGNDREFKIHVFVIRKWKGEPQGTKEMHSPTWFPFGVLPRNMWPTDKLWVPWVLEGGIFRAEFDSFGKETVLRRYNVLNKFSN